MSSQEFGVWTGTPMDERDIDKLLHDQGYGVLSLARDGEAYGLPVSIGFDGDETLYFVMLETNPPQQKIEFAEATETASLNVSDISGRFEWQSIILQGSLRSLERDSDEWETMLDTLDDNAWFDSVYTRSKELQGVTGWALDIEELSGLEKHEN